jgi:hypothetical protein
VVTGNRTTCQNCGARVYASTTFTNIKSTEEAVYNTLFKEERTMKYLRFVGLVMVVVGIFLVFLGFIFPDFLIGAIILGFGLGLIVGGAILIYQNVKEFE